VNQKIQADRALAQSTEPLNSLPPTEMTPMTTEFALAQIQGSCNDMQARLKALAGVRAQPGAPAAAGSVPDMLDQCLRAQWNQVGLSLAALGSAHGGTVASGTASPASSTNAPVRNDDVIDVQAREVTATPAAQHSTEVE
jgi:hypothetical protein